MSYLAALRPIIEEAGRIALETRAEGLTVTEKSDGTPVTNADIRVSEFLTRELLAAYPHTRVISEEHADLSGVSHPLTWVLDPIDGTKKFAAGKNVWCVMVSLFDTAPVCSMIYYPEGPVWYWSERGKGAFVEENGVVTSLHVPEPSAQRHIVHAPNAPVPVGERGSHGFMKHVRKLLFGRIDGYIRGPIGYWDLVPPMGILVEAGAAVRDLHGETIALTDSDAMQRGVLIAHAKLVPWLVEQTKQ